MQQQNEDIFKKVLTKTLRCDIIYVSIATQREGRDIMKKKRKKKHERYYAIPAYQTLSRRSNVEMAEILGVCVRTYKDKIEGYSDFTSEQGKLLSSVLGVSQDDLFLT